jgi:hypothetical protein
MTDIPLTEAEIEKLASFDHHLACNDDCTQKRLSRQLLVTLRERDTLYALLNTPEIHDFIKAVPLEAAHQRQRWGSDHDDGKTAADWFWLIGYLAGKPSIRRHPAILKKPCTTSLPRRRRLRIGTPRFWERRICGRELLTRRSQRIRHKTKPGNYT